ncbi:MAG TPA: HK97 gp10 family phage protein [Prolixibacteraceae bacterium]|nr:HK97 gp10 family phage protein [Prolixibacteraceae bacterium]
MGNKSNSRRTTREPVEIEFTGVENIHEIFAKLPEQYGKKPVTATFRKGAAHFVKALKQSAPVASGDTKKSIGIKGGKGASIIVGFRTGKTYMPAWFKAYWNNYGTLSERDPSHQFVKSRKKKTINWKGGIRPLRFVEKSWDATRAQVQNTINEELVSQTEKFLKKHAVQ